VPSLWPIVFTNSVRVLQCYLQCQTEAARSRRSYDSFAFPLIAFVHSLLDPVRVDLLLERLWISSPLALRVLCRSLPSILQGESNSISAPDLSTRRQQGREGSWLRGVETMALQMQVNHLKGGNVELRSPRLLLRGARDEDAEALYEAFSDPEAMRYW
jgi:hypothetical protein